VSLYNTRRCWDLEQFFSISQDIRIHINIPRVVNLCSNIYRGLVGTLNLRYSLFLLKISTDTVIKAQKEQCYQPNTFRLIKCVQ